MNVTPYMERVELMMLYCGIVAFRFHPGVKDPQSYQDCMLQAVLAYREFKRACEEDLWPG